MLTNGGGGSGASLTVQVGTGSLGGESRGIMGSVETNDAEEAKSPIPEPRPSQPSPAVSGGGGRRATTVPSYDDHWTYEHMTLERTPGVSLGFSIAGGTDNPMYGNNTAIFITKLTPGGLAELDGRLRPNDILCDVNGVSLVDAEHTQAVQALKEAGNRVFLVSSSSRAKSPLSLLTLLPPSLCHRLSRGCSPRSSRRSRSRRHRMGWASPYRADCSPNTSRTTTASSSPRSYRAERLTLTANWPWATASSA